tara:strand:- start:2264 stop:2746 length:483 start_codon:yes stop_codon:yes gene_type:complete
MNYFQKIKKEIKDLGFEIILEDFKRPWGGFLVINESQSQDFANQFFNGINVDSLKIGGKLSPKILIMKPNSKLSWQYHNRRAEIWKVYRGNVGISTSMDNYESQMTILKENDQIKLKQGERHRLIGLDNFSVISEIWQHTESDKPSDENDIVRISDEYGR